MGIQGKGATMCELTSQCWRDRNPTGYGSILALLLSYAAIPLGAHAQVTADGSLSTTVNSIDGVNFTIDSGGRSGNHLFHSFDQFSVPTNGSVTFNNDTGITHIFSRVTGNTPSSIDGLIQANGNANVFLLNPSGIQFGSNARLAIGGSFFATTANSLDFADGLQFSTSTSNRGCLECSKAPGR